MACGLGRFRWPRRRAARMWRGESSRRLRLGAPPLRTTLTRPAAAVGVVLLLAAGGEWDFQGRGHRFQVMGLHTGESGAVQGIARDAAGGFGGGLRFRGGPGKKADIGPFHGTARRAAEGVPLKVRDPAGRSPRGTTWMPSGSDVIANGGSVALQAAGGDDGGVPATACVAVAAGGRCPLPAGPGDWSGLPGLAPAPLGRGGRESGRRSIGADQSARSSVCQLPPATPKRTADGATGVAGDQHQVACG